MLDQRVERGARLEAAGERHDAGARVPGGEHARPCVLGPARRGNVEMRVPGPQAQTVHGREMAYRIACVSVDDELGAGGCAGSEIQKHRIVRRRRRVRLKAHLDAAQGAEGAPACRGFADGNALDVRGEAGEFRRVFAVRDQILGLAAVHPVGDVGGRKLRHRGNQR